MQTNSQPPKSSKCLVLAAITLITFFPLPANAQGYVAPKPTAQEVHWHQEFVHLFDAGHTHEAVVAASNFNRLSKILMMSKGGIYSAMTGTRSPLPVL
jgi:hypothetical protein